MNHVQLFHSQTLPRIRYFTNLNNIATRNLNRKSPSNTAIFAEKYLEGPTVAIPQNNKVDMIGPPDPLSNLRPIIRYASFNETVLQKKLRNLQDETQAWNQKFWSEHNARFIREKQEYIKKHRPSDNNVALTADEMSEFYKSFLDKNWETHVKYNFEWYKRNFTILFLSIRVFLESVRS